MPLAIIGAVLLTPDTLLMRLSQLDGWNMLIWRGGLSSLAYLLIWIMMDQHKSWSKVFTRHFGILILCQIANAVLFSLAIAAAPVVIVLIGVATVPIFAAFLSRVILKEPLSKLTLLTAMVVFSGLLISMSGDETQSFMRETNTLVGLLLGLGVAVALAMNFTLIRKERDAPFVLAMTIGALCAGSLGLFCADTLQWLPAVNMMAIALTGICILPLSFAALAYAAKTVKSSTVSLIMLSETVLGPLWVWWGIGEQPNVMMVIGGAIVLSALAIFIVLEHRRNANAS